MREVILPIIRSSVTTGLVIGASEVTAYEYVIMSPILLYGFPEVMVLTILRLDNLIQVPISVI